MRVHRITRFLIKPYWSKQSNQFSSSLESNCLTQPMSTSAWSFRTRASNFVVTVTVQLLWATPYNSKYLLTTKNIFYAFLKEPYTMGKPMRREPTKFCTTSYRTYRKIFLQVFSTHIDKTLIRPVHKRLEFICYSTALVVWSSGSRGKGLSTW